MAIFSFELSQLDKIIPNVRERQREREFLEEKFKEWKLSNSAKISLDEETLKQIIIGERPSPEENARLLVEWADKLGAVFKSTGLTSSQIRNVFGEIKSIQNQGFTDPKARRRFILLVPKIQYAAVRARKFGMDGLRDVLTSCNHVINDDVDNFQHFLEFFEAILAYHKAYGGG